MIIKLAVEISYQFLKMFATFLYYHQVKILAEIHIIQLKIIWDILI